MGSVIYLSERAPIPPKSINELYLRQRYTVTFDPNAASHEAWVWEVAFTQTYRFMGSSKSLELAKKQAKKRITRMSNEVETQEANE